jgi:hypothetical protein
MGGGATAETLASRSLPNAASLRAIRASALSFAPRSDQSR